MSYAQAIEGLHALAAELHTPRRKFDLEQMRVLAAALGHPEQKFPSVLIAGTNGKGSTAAMLAGILRAAGHRTGLYTSPHLARVNERIQIDGLPISDEDFARLYFRVDETAARLVREAALPQHPSFFETVTALAFLYFAEQNIQIAVLEVGIGGRLDATNIVEPLVSILTDISLDHQEWLGDTLTAIAREKSGILRTAGTLVTLPQHPEVNQAIGEVAMSLNIRGINAVEYLPAAHTTDPGWLTPYAVEVLGERIKIAPPLPGSHQHRNTALAIAAAVELCNNNGYKMLPRQISEGIRNTRWPGRLELFPATTSHPAILFDVAHNPAGTWTLRSALSSYPTPGPKTLLFGCLRDKAFQEMAQILFPIFDRVVLTPVDSPRTVVAEDLLAVAQKVSVPATLAVNPRTAWEEALRQTPPNGLLVCAGSVYLVGALRDRIAPEEQH